MGVITHGIIETVIQLGRAENPRNALRFVAGEIRF